LTGRTIVITGASDGVGAAATRKLAADGENVVVVGRSPAKTKAFAADMDADYFIADFSKIAIIMFIRELNRRYNAEGLTCASFHPGWVVSNFAPSSSSRAIAIFQATGIGRIIGTTPEQACDQLVWLATTVGDRDWTSGEYYVKRRIGKNHKITNDPEAARELWDRTAALVAG
jgi:NAD(P)-dependent dehydrogenase (short-subunit alcohol dehydrogenase family)